MKQTNDEIEIKITKKDRVYLSIILSLICVMAIVCILVPRYYQLQNQFPNTPTTQSGTQTSSSTTPETAVPSVDNSQYQSDSSVNQPYANSYTTLVINTLKNVGVPYSTLSRHLDSYNILDVNGLNIDSTQLSYLESLSLPIHTTIENYINNGTIITATLIDNDNLLHSQIVALSNALNTLSN